MNVLDLLILGGVLLAGIGGYRLGLLARAASWVGMALGLYLAYRLLPTAIDVFEGPDSSSRLGITLLVLIGGAFIGQAVGLLFGMRVHRFIPHGPIKVLDKSMGGVFGAFGVLVVVWALVLPSMRDVEGWAAGQARNSVIARAIDGNAPPPPDTFQALRRLVGDTPFPKVFEDLRPTPDPGPPPAVPALSAQVVARVAASTVKVEGEACRRVQEGSGFAVRPDLIVTNAHVVAGVRTPRVRRPDGRRLSATVALFDPDRDLALLRVRNLGEPPLPVGAGKAGDQGAVFGHPGGQNEVRAAPAQVNSRVQAVGRDLYDTHSTRRDVFILAATLHPGDSGGPLVNTAGSVIGVAFAIAPDKPGTAYAVTSRELNAVLAAPQGQASTGDCLSAA